MSASPGLRSIASLIASAAIYGYTVGVAHSELYARRNLVKLPLLIVGSGILCGLAYYLIGRSFSSKMTAARVRRLSVGLFRDLTVLLLSLAPANLFLALVLRHTAGSGRGEYGLFLGVNVLFVAAAGGLALVRRGRELLTAEAISGSRATSILAAWLALTLLVGGQGAFYLRPFFGLPASRGNTPPFALGNEPDVRGARNFFEAVVQVVTDPPLPASWGAPYDSGFEYEQER